MAIGDKIKAVLPTTSMCVYDWLGGSSFATAASLQTLAQTNNHSTNAMDAPGAVVIAKAVLDNEVVHAFANDLAINDAVGCYLYLLLRETR